MGRKLSFLVSVLLVIAIIFSGCIWKNIGDEGNSSSDKTPPPVKGNSALVVTENDLKTAKANVKDYLELMKDDKYAESYAFLSIESKKMHSLSEFIKDVKQGMPQLDFDTMKAEKTEKGILVSISFYEDPSAAGYNLVKENGDWVIVYRGGSPAMPTDI